MTTAILDTLRQAVGAAHVLTDGDLSAYERDWRGRMQGKALAVVRPASTQEVAAVVKVCAAAGVAIIPQGGNTGLSVGSTPDASGTQVVLSLTRMHAIRAVDADNLTITVEAGCILQNLQQAAQQARLRALRADNGFAAARPADSRRRHKAQHRRLRAGRPFSFRWR